MSLIENERTKPSASALNGVAIASIVAGVITPVAAVAFGVPGAGGRGPALTVVAAAAFLGIGDRRARLDLWTVAEIARMM